MIWKVAFFYYIVINVVAFVVMGIDKNKACNHKYRISEATLFTLALVGGAVGSNLGMQLYRHKTKHMQFVLGMPAILLVQCIVIIILLIKF